MFLKHSRDVRYNVPTSEGKRKKEEGENIKTKGEMIDITI